MNKYFLTCLMLVMSSVASALAQQKLVYVYAVAYGKTHCGSETVLDWAATTVPSAERWPGEQKMRAVVLGRTPNVTWSRTSSSQFHSSTATHVVVFQWAGGTPTCRTNVVSFQFGPTMEAAMQNAEEHFKLWAPANTPPFTVLEHAPIVARDSDDDGYSDNEELKRGTDPFVKDPVVNQPDASIGFSSGSMVGSDFYDSEGLGQFAPAKIKIGKSKGCFLSVRNAGQAGDAIGVKGSQGSADITVSYTYKKKNVTSEVVAGTFKFPELAPGERKTLKANVKVKKSAIVEEPFDLQIDTTSELDPSATDRVIFSITPR